MSNLPQFPKFKKKEVIIESDEREQKATLKFLEENIQWKNAVEEDPFEYKNTTIKLKHRLHKEGITLAYQCYRQKTKPRGVMFMFHSFGGCVSRDCGFTANVLKEDGFDVYGLDQETQGRSVPKGKKIETLCTNFETFVLNGCQFVQDILTREKTRYSKVPLFLWGFSFGGATVCLMSVNQEFRKSIGRKIDGLILNAPAIEPSEKPGVIAYSILSVLSFFVPLMELPAPKTTSEPPPMCSRFKIWNDKFLKHPECYHGQMKMVSARQALLMCEEAKKSGSKIDVPFIVFHGDADTAAHIKGSEHLLRAGKEKDDRRLVKFSGGLHSLTVDWCGRQLVYFTRHWVLERCQNNPSKKKEEEEEEEEIDVEE